MNNQFNALEIMKMAMNIELQGKEFYQQCIEANDKEEVKKIFTKLRNDEKDHYKFFKKLLDQFDLENRSVNQEYLYEEEVNNYLTALVDTKVFPTEDTKTAEIANNLTEAINLGIQAEKNSLLLYLELIEVEKDKQTITALEKLIKEEKEHLVELKQLKKII